MPKIAHSDGFAEKPESKENRPPETRFDEDQHTVTNNIEQLMSCGYTFWEAQELMPTIVAGIKSERAYRREQQQTLKALGFTVGRALYRDFIAPDEAGRLLANFNSVIEDNPDLPPVGLELGHIELGSGDHAVIPSRKELDDFGVQVINAAGLEEVSLDAHSVDPSARTALIRQQKVDGAPEILARGRTNFPVRDLGNTGVNLFVRVSVGYIDPKTPFENHDNFRVRELHQQFMDIVASKNETRGIVLLDKKSKSIGHPLATTLVAYHRGPLHNTQ